QLVRNCGAQLNRQVTDAARGVQNIRLRKCARRTGVKARPASAAVVGCERFVIVERDAGQQGSEKKVAAGRFVNQQRVFADPTQAGKLSKFPFQKRRRIDDAASPRIGGGLV